MAQPADNGAATFPPQTVMVGISGSVSTLTTVDDGFLRQRAENICDVAMIRGLSSEHPLSETNSALPKEMPKARLLEYFTPMLSFGLAIDERITTGDVRSSVDEVHAHARVLIEQARTNARAAGKMPAAVESAAFALVAWFDEMVARHPPWRGQVSPLQVQLFNTFSAGDEFFEHLSHLKAADGEVREVYYYALLLGFVGLYYFENDDHGELGKIKELNSRQLPIAPMPLPALHEKWITPQPYEMKDPAGPRYPTRWDALRMMVGAIFTSPRMAKVESSQSDDDGKAQEKVSAPVRQAKRLVAQLPATRGAGPSLYHLPWLLFLGDIAADVHGLLQAATTSSPSSAAFEVDSDAIQQFWYFKSMVAIETGPRIVCDPSERAERRLWQQALKRLAHERNRLPINGIVVCIGSASLMGDAEALRKTAARLHRLLDESTNYLQLQLPVYVCVTGVETLPGYASLRRALPVEVLTQAIGWRLSEKQVPDVDIGDMFDGHFAIMMDRLHAVRLSVLANQRETKERRGVFDFVQSLGELRTGLRNFVQLLLDSKALQRKACWRGLYVIGSSESDVKGGAFVADLFERLLPADQSLAEFSSRAATHR